MAGEQAYEERTTASGETTAVDESQPLLFYTYRHGNGRAEIIAAELTDAARHGVEIVETGESLLMRLVVRSNRNIDQPVIGFLIRNRHGISAYGTNTKEQQIEFGAVRRGEVLEAVFSFNCWLGIDDYSISCALHSHDGEAYDWLDGVRSFRVTSQHLIEGIANINDHEPASRLEHRLVASPESQR